MNDSLNGCQSPSVTEPQREPRRSEAKENAINDIAVVYCRGRRPRRPEAKRVFHVILFYVNKVRCHILVFIFVSFLRGVEDVAPYRVVKISM